MRLHPSISLNAVETSPKPGREAIACQGGTRAIAHRLGTEPARKGTAFRSTTKNPSDKDSQMRTEAFRRHKTAAKMLRRVREDRNQHYADRSCRCYTRAGMAMFKEQPKFCSLSCCGNPRRFEKGAYRLTIQERRNASI